MKKVLLIFGTRPEAVKMAPLIKEFKKNKDKFNTKVCVTAQHREMLDQVLLFFDIKPDFDLNLMRPSQTLYQLTADVIVNLKSVMEEFKPDIVLVHGDTTTSTTAALTAFYSGSKVGHIEAGLRTYDKYSPFPEEINRQITSRIADYHFAPTELAKNNLLNEGINENAIVITGNTVIDALLWAQKKLEKYEDEEILKMKNIINTNKKLILVTGHRRENFGEGFMDICKAIRHIAKENNNVQIIYPVHLNPNVQIPVYKLLNNSSNIYLTNPLGYPAFVWLMKQSHIILTDSGGIQEEAPSLGKPVLVMRNTTERPEAVRAGTVKLVGTNYFKIINEILLLLTNIDHYNTMSRATNPYGDGHACYRIVEYISSNL